MGTRERINMYIDFFECRHDWLGLPLEELLRQWHSEHVMSDVCFECRLKALKLFCKWCERNRIRKPTSKHLSEYIDELKAKGVSLSSVKTYFAQIRAVFCMLDRFGVYEDISRRIRMQDGSRKERKFLTKDEAKRLMNADMRERDKAIIALMLYCGLRCVEVSELKWSDIDGNRAVIRGKGRKEKNTWIMLPKTVIDCLDAYRDGLESDTSDDDFVFMSVRCSDDGVYTPMTAEAISQCVSKILRKMFSEKEGISAHCLRHTAITLAIESGMELHRVSRFARHSSTATTMIYVHDSKRFSDPAEERIEHIIENGCENKSSNDAEMIEFKRLLRRLLET